jgi:hypothetical protein
LLIIHCYISLQPAPLTGIRKVRSNKYVAST